MARACFLWEKSPSFLFLYFPSEVNLSTLFKWSFRVLVLASSNITRNRYDEETEFILYRGDQRRSGLNYARPCRECVDNIMRIFFPHECRRDADGWNEWIYNGGERFALTSTRPQCIIFILQDTPLVIQNEKSRSHRASCNPLSRVAIFSSTYYFSYLIYQLLHNVLIYPSASRVNCIKLDAYRADTIKFIRERKRRNYSAISPLCRFANAN